MSPGCGVEGGDPADGTGSPQEEGSSCLHVSPCCGGEGGDPADGTSSPQE